MKFFQERVFPAREALFAALSQRVVSALQTAIELRGAATLVVSGGSTPVPLFKLLAAAPLDWPRLTITLAHERWVATADPASNEKLVRDLLLVGPAGAAGFVGLKTHHATPEEAESTCHAALAALARPFDTVLLGFGDDGHFASLFPGAPALQRGLDPDTASVCIAMQAPGAAQPRMSLTLAALSDSRELLLLSTGARKREVLQRALQPGPVADLPLRALLHSSKTPLTHFWAP